MNDMDNSNCIKLKPELKQYIINELSFFVLLVVCLTCGGTTGFQLATFCQYAAAFLGLYLLFKLLYIRSMEYIITDEQLIYRHGIVRHTTEYMELCRVIDYQQSQSLMQQFCHLKTITILSGDKTMPELELIGIKTEMQIVEEIRKRVEYNKKRRGIYEITNRF